MTQRIESLVEEPKKKLKGGYIKELKDELKRVSWTSSEELIRSTKAVVISTFLFGLGIYVTDLVVRGFLDSLHLLFHKIIG